MLLKNRTIFSSRKRQKQYIDQLQARIDIVREGLISSPFDLDLVNIINDLTDEVSLLLLDGSWKQPLPDSNWATATSYILSLNEIAASARRVNRGLNFSAQRSSFRILQLLFHHPQYSELQSWWSLKEDKDFDVVQIMYSAAEHQNHDPCLFGDLYAEGEWVRGILGSPDSSPNPDGLGSALVLWENFISFSAQNSPDRIPRLFENLKEATISSTYENPTCPIMLPESSAFIKWKAKFSTIEKFRISTLKDTESAFKILHGQSCEDEWSFLNNEFDENSNFIGQLPEHLDIWSACIQGSVLNSIVYMYGICAFHNLWKEIKDCWYLSQPKNADGNYCDHPLLTRCPQAFSHWIRDHVIPARRTIYDRHNLAAYSSAFCTVIIADYIANEKSFSFSFDSIKEAKETSSFIQRLKTQTKLVIQESIVDAFEWGSKKAEQLKNEVEVFFELEDDKCKKYIENSLMISIPCIENQEDRELIYAAWERTNHNFWNHWQSSNSIKLKFSKKLPSQQIQRFFTAHKAYHLSRKSGQVISNLSFGGRSTAISLKRYIAKNLMPLASNSLPMKIPEEWTWFIAKNDWNSQGRKRLTDKYSFDYSSSKYIVVDSIQRSFVAENDVVELVLFEWASIPWSHIDQPVVVYGFTEFSENTTGITSLYYDLKILNPNGIYLLPN